MALQVIGCEAVTQLLEKLMAEGRVVAPQQREGQKQWAFDEVKDPCDVCLDYTSTILPPKKYAFPPKEKLLHYELTERPTMEAVIEAEPLVIFGAHPCDIYGLNALDKALCDQSVDPNWAARRAQIRIVGVDCEPDEYCFCGSMGTASVASGFDLFLTPLNGDYMVEVATPAGAAMLAGIATREPTSDETGAVKKRLEAKLRQEHKINCDVNSLPMHFAGFDKSPVWQEAADKCYSCGTCNLTCPTCFCFDVLDEMDLSLASGNREREWDGCMLEEFAQVASGENFREEREDRLKHRFFRKYSYLFTKYGQPYCCGCGRCVRQCLVHIDPVDTINKLLAHSGKEA
jgi:hypothetical protein